MITLVKTFAKRPTTTVAIICNFLKLKLDGQEEFLHNRWLLSMIRSVKKMRGNLQAPDATFSIFHAIIISILE